MYTVLTWVVIIYDGKQEIPQHQHQHTSTRVLAIDFRNSTLRSTHSFFNPRILTGPVRFYRHSTVWTVQ